MPNRPNSETQGWDLPFLGFPRVFTEGCEFENNWGELPMEKQCSQFCGIFGHGDAGANHFRFTCCLCEEEMQKLFNAFAFEGDP